MSGDLAAILGLQQAALLAESACMGRVPVIVAALGQDTLEQYWRNQPRHAVRFDTFAEGGQAVVQHGPAGAVLWMNPHANTYRSVFNRFLRTFWGSTQDLTRSGFDVDHVYNRARAKHYGYGLVRMFLVRDVINREHGRTYEKGIGAAEKNRFVKIMKLLDGMTELKVVGVPPVTNGLLTPAHHEAARRCAAHYGISYESALDTLRAMFERAGGD